ncbi:MAG TPA: hypothetical protein VFQ88_03320 [Nevskiaceae bacterium]|nr:hypothetical protein [Nevskiaceae bacterium]
MAAIPALPVASDGLIATFLPNAAAPDPLHLQSTGTGLVAAGSKAGGIAGAMLSITGIFHQFATSAARLRLSLAASPTLMWISRIEIRGRSLEAIEREHT